MIEALDGDWIRRFHAVPDGTSSLVFLPHAGGSASYFRPFSGLMSPSINTFAVQYPGRQDRRHEPFIDNVAGLADAITDVLSPLAGRPLVLFGHSLGASVAFEVARRWPDRGHPPLTALCVSGRRAPSGVRDERVHLLDDDGVLAEVKQLSGTDTAALDDPEVRAMVLPAIRNDYRAAETYRYTGPPVSCPIVALVGVDDPRVTVSEAGAWADFTTGPFRLRRFDGGHFYLIDHQRQVADLLSGLLTSADD